MISSLDNQTPPPSTNSFNKRPRPTAKLKLNVNIKPFEDKSIIVAQNSTSSYLIQNHPSITDLSESVSSSKYIFKKVFFGENYESKNSENFSHLGNHFYIIQKSNGKEMQDTYKTKTVTGFHSLSFFAVYDGHSTQTIAEMLANKLDDYIMEGLHENKDISTSIKEAFIKIENEVAAMLGEWRPRGGSTALCGVIYGGNLYVANLGDSRAVMFQSENYKSLSNLHDFTNENERIYVENKGGIVLNNRLEGELAVSRSIGDIRYKHLMNKEPEIIVHQIHENDEYLILGTDGFWNGLDPEQTLSTIKMLKEKIGYEKLGLKEMGDNLIEEACLNIKTKKDNMTLIIINMKGIMMKA